MLSIVGIKKTIKQHTADMDVTDSVDYKISTSYVIPSDHLKNKSSLLWSLCYSMGFHR
jgi:hypothetical protein